MWPATSLSACTLKRVCMVIRVGAEIHRGDTLLGVCVQQRADHQRMHAGSWDVHIDHASHNMHSQPCVHEQLAGANTLFEIRHGNEQWALRSRRVRPDSQGAAKLQLASGWVPSWLSASLLSLPCSHARSSSLQSSQVCARNSPLLTLSLTECRGQSLGCWSFSRTFHSVSTSLLYPCVMKPSGHWPLAAACSKQNAC
jgi:hypothetical protein